MCKAISLVSMPLNKNESWVYLKNLFGRIYGDSYSNDSHTHIAEAAAKECDFLRAKCEAKRKKDGWGRPCDLVNKWEWNPFSNRLVTDTVRSRFSDKEAVRNFLDELEPKKVIGTKVQLKPKGYGGHWICFYRKTSRSKWIQLRVDVPQACIPVKWRNKNRLNATVYRKPRGGWSFKDLSIG